MTKTLHILNGDSAANFFEIINSNLLSAVEIVKNLLTWQQNETVYGFGDMQYFLHLNKLEKQYSIKENKYYLNEKGNAKINQ